MPRPHPSCSGMRPALAPAAGHDITPEQKLHLGGPGKRRKAHLRAPRVLSSPTTGPAKSRCCASRSAPPSSVSLGYRETTAHDGQRSPTRPAGSSWWSDTRARHRHGGGRRSLLRPPDAAGPAAATCSPSPPRQRRLNGICRSLGFELSRRRGLRVPPRASSHLTMSGALISALRRLTQPISSWEVGGC